MRLLTHNMLQCPRTKGYPLTLEVYEAEEVQVEYSRAFVERMATRLDWRVFRSAAAPFTKVQLPVDVPGSDDDDEVWRTVHRALLEWHVVRGLLRSPDGAVYNIEKGIPNLIITEVEQPTGGAHDPAVVADVPNAANIASGRDDDDDE